MTVYKRQCCLNYPENCKDHFSLPSLTCCSNIHQMNIIYNIIWLALWAGKINQILCCDWLPEQARWSYLACSGFLTSSRKINDHFLVFYHIQYILYSAGNNSRSSDIVRPNFENVRPTSHYDRTRWPNMSPAHLEFSSSRCCQSINYVRSNLSNVRPTGRFERTYVLWIKKNYFQHCLYKPSLFGQDGWILTLFFFSVFINTQKLIKVILTSCLVRI